MDLSLFRVRQTFDSPHIPPADIPGLVHAELAKLSLSQQIGPGQTVAISVGSRGIANLKFIIRAVVQHLQLIGAMPFIVPAMGSHGGGTAEGQRALIEGYGVSEAFCGCPIRSSMETVVVCQAAEGFPVYFDKHAFNADHVLVVGRVKPHTGFVGDIESGLMKMMLIGLGKHAGAAIYHRAITNYSFGQIVRSVAREVLTRCRVVAGLAIVENAKDETALIEGVQPNDFETREKDLLVLAKRWLPKLPFQQADILMIDQIGKNISGTGMDTNVIGRKYNDHVAMENEWPKCRRIIVRGLTTKSNGNATGIGISEFCRSRVIEQMDVGVTRVNCLTGAHPTAAMLPLDYATDRECLRAAMSTIGLVEPPDVRLMWIHHTLDVVEVECSAAYLPETIGRDDLEIIASVRSLPLDAEGNLPDGHWDVT